MKIIISESQNIFLIEQKLPSVLSKLFGAKTAKKVAQIFTNEIDNIEVFFTKLISTEEKILIVKSGQYYLKSSIGYDVPTSTIKTILDLATSGKINKSNMEHYLTLLPEYFSNGAEFRNNIRKLVNGTINRVEKGVGKTITKKEVSKTISDKIPKGSFKMADSEESFKIAGWLDQKFYEANNKRHGEISDIQIDKMLPETKSYILSLLETIKNYSRSYRNGNFYNPETNLIIQNEKDLLKFATSNFWGGYQRPGILVNDKMYSKKPVPSLPIPTKSVEDNLNSIFPTPASSMYANGKNFWNSL